MPLINELDALQAMVGEEMVDTVEFLAQTYDKDGVVTEVVTYTTVGRVALAGDSGSEETVASWLAGVSAVLIHMPTVAAVQYAVGTTVRVTGYVDGLVTKYVGGAPVRRGTSPYDFTVAAKTVSPVLA